MENKPVSWKSKLKSALVIRIIALLIIFLCSLGFFFLEGIFISIYSRKNLPVINSAKSSKKVLPNTASTSETTTQDVEISYRERNINYNKNIDFNISKKIFKSAKSGLRLLKFKKNVSEWKERTFRAAGVPTFTQYSAYRMGPSKIRIIGITVHKNVRKFNYGKCYWYGNNGRKIAGIFTWENDNQSPQFFGSEMFECLLHNKTGDDGGYLKAEIDKVNSILFTEEPNQPQDKLTPFPYTFSYCLAPMHDDVDGRSLHEWMEYHRVVMHADYFVFYNINALNSEILSYLKPYMIRNMAEVIEFEDVMAYNLWYYGQVLASWDCAAHMAFKTKWIFLHDIDEYLQVFPPYNIHYWLRKYDDVAWLTHGMFQWNISMCINGTNESDNDTFAVEKMVYRRKQHFCFIKPESGPCLGWHGHRKLIINPRKCSIIETHMVMNPESDGYDFKLSEVRHHHYRHLSVKRSSYFRCSTIPDHISHYPDYNLLYNVADLAKVTKRHPFPPLNQSLKFKSS